MSDNTSQNSKDQKGKFASLLFKEGPGIAPLTKAITIVIAGIVGGCAFLFGRDKDIKHATTPAPASGRRLSRGATVSMPEPVSPSPVLDQTEPSHSKITKREKPEKKPAFRNVTAVTGTSLGRIGERAYRQGVTQSSPPGY